MRAIETRDVVAEQKRGPFRQRVELFQGFRQAAAGIGERLTGVAANGSEAVNAAILLSHLQVDAEAFGFEGDRRGRWRRQLVQFSILSMG
ncbi:MAG: hypothetical protein RLO46_18720 [Pseudomonadales bacterium]